MTFILINLAGLLGVFVLSRAIYNRDRTLVTFTNIFSLFWGISLFTSMTYAGGLLRVSTATLFVVYGAWLALLVGALIILSLPPHQRKARAEIVKKRAFYVLGLLLAANVCAIYFDLGMNLAVRSKGAGDLVGDLAVARIQGELLGTSPPLFLGIFRYAFILYLPLMAIMWRKKWISTTWFVIICVATGITCLSGFTRAPFVQLFVTLFISLFVVFPERRSKLLLWGMLLASATVGGFLSMQTLLSGSESVDEESFSDSVVSYVGGPMKAYDLLLKGEYPTQRGFYSLDMINYPLHRMGLVGSYPSLVREEVSLPFPTNVYTFLDAFTLDFGPLGAILGSFGIGVLVALAYRHAARESYVGLTAYCLTTYYLVMATLNNEFLRFNFPFYILLAWLIQHAICSPARHRGLERRTWQPGLSAQVLEPEHKT